MSGIATIFLWHDYFCFCLFVCLSGFVQSLEFLKKSWNLQTSFTDLEESGKDGKKSGVFCFENCNKCIFAKWSFFQAVKSYLFRLNENIQSHLLIIGINTATSVYRVRNLLLCPLAPGATTRLGLVAHRIFGLSKLLFQFKPRNRGS